jgi:hypothetical protein
MECQGEHGYACCPGARLAGPRCGWNCPQQGLIALQVASGSVALTSAVESV